VIVLHRRNVQPRRWPVTTLFHLQLLSEKPVKKQILWRSFAGATPFRSSSTPRLIAHSARLGKTSTGADRSGGHFYLVGSTCGSQRTRKSKPKIASLISSDVSRRMCRERQALAHSSRSGSAAVIVLHRRNVQPRRWPVTTLFHLQLLCEKPVKKQILWRSFAGATPFRSSSTPRLIAHSARLGKTSTRAILASRRTRRSVRPMNLFP
jgi:hypothetical protein